MTAGAIKGETCGKGGVHDISSYHIWPNEKC
jgi:hypothetical protein